MLSDTEIRPKMELFYNIIFQMILRGCSDMMPSILRGGVVLGDVSDNKIWRNLQSVLHDSTLLRSFVYFEYTHISIPIFL